MLREARHEQLFRLARIDITGHDNHAWGCPVNDWHAAHIVLTGLLFLAPIASVVYWFATTYVTKRHLEDECGKLREEAERLRMNLKAVETRINSAERELKEGHAVFAAIRAELGFINKSLTVFGDKLDKLFEPRGAASESKR